MSSGFRVWLNVVASWRILALAWECSTAYLLSYRGLYALCSGPARKALPIATALRDRGAFKLSICRLKRQKRLKPIRFRGARLNSPPPKSAHQ